MSSLKQITVQGYKSIQSLENFALKPLNILIGANGAGKSNFISLFKLLANIEAQNLQIYTQVSGGPDSLLFYSRQITHKILMKFDFGLHGYGFNLIPTADNRLIFESESLYLMDSSSIIANGNEESQLKNTKLTVTDEICSIISNLKIYHFHDTSDNAKIKQLQPVANNLKLQGDASFFKDFVFRERVENIELEWAEIKNPDQPFKAYMLSDGTLRFICLSTLLLQPYHLMPEIILIDEPELGLHPYAINILSSLIQRASEKKQLIISSQSVELIDNFNPDDLVIINHKNNRTVFNRLDNDKLKVWLEEYSLSELWKSNLLGGRPSR